MVGLRYLEEVLVAHRGREVRLGHLAALGRQVGAHVVALISDTQQGFVAHASDEEGSPIVRIASHDPDAACRALEAALRALMPVQA